MNQSFNEPVMTQDLSPTFYEFMSELYLSKAGQSRMKAYLAQPLSQLLQEKQGERSLETMRQEQHQRKNRLGSLMMSLMNEQNFSPVQLFQLFQQGGLNQSLDSNLDSVLNVQHQKTEKQLETSDSQRDVQDLPVVNEPEKETDTKIQTFVEVVRTIELPTQPKSSPLSDETLMQKVYNPIVIQAERPKQSISEKLLESLTHLPIEEIKYSTEFESHFKHIQRWSDLNKLREWSSVSEEIRISGLTYFTAHLNYLKTLPIIMRPLNASGEGAYRTLNAQLKSAVKSTLIPGLNQVSHLGYEQWLTKVKMARVQFIKTLQADLQLSTQEISSESDHSVMEFEQFCGLPEVTHLQHMIKQGDPAYIKSAVHNIVNRQICTHKDPYLGRVLAKCEGVRQIFSGRAYKELRANLSAFIIKSPLPPKQEPEVLSTEEPEVLSTEEPEVLSTEEPEVLSTEEPEVLSTQEPEVLSTEEPETLSTQEPEVLSTQEPETLKPIQLPPIGSMKALLMKRVQHMALRATQRQNKQIQRQNSKKTKQKPRKSK